MASKRPRLDRWWTPLLNAAGGRRRLLCVEPNIDDASLRRLDDLIVEHVGPDIGRSSRLGLLGSISYQFPGLLYSDGGPELVREIVQTAGSSLAAQGAGSFSTLVIGGSMGDSPQDTFATCCSSGGMAVVHILPCCRDAEGDLAKVLFLDKERSIPRQRANWYVCLVGSGWSERNVALAYLARQYVVAGGGPGTLLEVLMVRSYGSGLLPLVRTGGLAEGVEFRGQGLVGMRAALQPPAGVDPASWAVMLGGGGHEEGTAVEAAPAVPMAGAAAARAAVVSPSDYLSAVKTVFGSVSAGSEKVNHWELDSTTNEWLERFLHSVNFGAAKS
jgi:predicted Rossmann-fold nucleotide-binding protein